MAPSPVILVDVSNLAFRAGFAFPNLSHNGVPTGAVYGTLKAILELRAKISPRMIFVWDHGVPVPGASKPANWRDQAVAEYKANRRQSGNPIAYQMVLQQMLDIFNVLKLLGYCSVSVPGMEADDVIGVLAHELPCDIRIFSNDKDFYQLVNKRIWAVSPKQKNSEYEILTAADIEREFGVPIPRWAEYLALGGDTSDNLNPAPGSRLFGPKTAAKLIASGVDLNKHPSKQPLAFWAKYGTHWRNIQLAYYAARIPTCWEDPRIVDCVKKAGGKPHYHTDQLNKDQEPRLQKFTQFLADYNMKTLLSVRHEFYVRRQTACNPSQPPAHPAKKPKRVPLF
jgi:5'-3' exonuclease